MSRIEYTIKTTKADQTHVHITIYDSGGYREWERVQPVPVNGMHSSAFMNWLLEPLIYEMHREFRRQMGLDP